MPSTQTALPPTTTSLPAEVEHGNVEYKLQLLNPTAVRFQHLVTQLNWRLNEGHGYAFYELGVSDDGLVIGMPPEDLETSLNTLFRMCQVLSAQMHVHTLREGTQHTYKAARVAVSCIAETHAKKQVRGTRDVTHSTLIGVLTRGCLDDGNGLARMQVFRHLHEIENGRTSSISEQILESRNASSIDAQSTKLIMFSDLAGHQRYLKITASGLTSQFPDYAMLVVDATAGVQSMTREHLRIVLGLGLLQHPTMIPIFQVSNVTGASSEFHINGHFQSDEVGTIVTGLVQRYGKQHPLLLIVVYLHLLNASMLLKDNVQGVIHAGPIQQLAKVVAVLKSDDNGQVQLRFEFVHSPEYMRPDWPLVFREANTHAVGKVLHAVHKEGTVPPDVVVVAGLA
ncbi:hypothetical protein DYB25_005117 [Aphanomyces astaci]|uniref:Elongation factor Tu, chloroplastic n=1 Tax=Aphanomyces astaci TaxID=112090 RepID=A0A397AXF4_APHAT|nr:hypothetical protein DYB25_005117 [Aphanomyces astaci]